MSYGHISSSSYCFLSEATFPGYENRHSILLCVVFCVHLYNNVQASLMT